jgi:hypothetical protein
MLLCAVLLALSSCKETNADRLKAMCGQWESVKNRPSFTVFESTDGYKVTMQRRTRRGEITPETYSIIEKDGYLFIETGFSILISYDKETDRILLSSGGEYIRSNKQSKN